MQSRGERENYEDKEKRICTEDLLMSPEVSPVDKVVYGNKSSTRLQYPCYRKGKCI